MDKMSLYVLTCASIVSEREFGTCLIGNVLFLTHRSLPDHKRYRAEKLGDEKR